MPLAWSKIKAPTPIPIPIPIPIQSEQEDVQIVTLPVYDKISVIEHKNVEVDDTRKKDDEIGSSKKSSNG